MADTTPVPASTNKTPTERAAHLRAHIDAILDGADLHIELPHLPDSHGRPPAHPAYNGCRNDERCNCRERNKWDEIEPHSTIVAAFDNAGFERVDHVHWWAPGHGGGHPSLAIIWRHQDAIAVTVSAAGSYTGSDLRETVLTVLPTDNGLNYRLSAHRNQNTETAYFAAFDEHDRFHHPYGPAACPLDELDAYTRRSTRTDWQLHGIELTAAAHATITGDTDRYTAFETFAEHGLRLRETAPDWKPRYELEIGTPHPQPWARIVYQIGTVDDLVDATGAADTVLARCNRMTEIVNGWPNLDMRVIQAAAEREIDDRELRIVAELAEAGIDISELFDAAHTIGDPA